MGRFILNKKKKQLNEWRISNKNYKYIRKWILCLVICKKILRRVAIRSKYTAVGGGGNCVHTTGCEKSHEIHAKQVEGFQGSMHRSVVKKILNIVRLFSLVGYITRGQNNNNNKKKEE